MKDRITNLIMSRDDCPIRTYTITYKNGETEEIKTNQKYYIHSGYIDFSIWLEKKKDEDLGEITIKSINADEVKEIKLKCKITYPEKCDKCGSVIS